MKMLIAFAIALISTCTHAEAWTQSNYPTLEILTELHQHVAEAKTAEQKACPQTSQGLPAADATEAINCAVARHAAEMAISEYQAAEKAHKDLAQPKDQTPEEKFDRCIFDAHDNSQDARQCDPYRPDIEPAQDRSSSDLNISP
jgi:hypothetical protein